MKLARRTFLQSPAALLALRAEPAAASGPVLVPIVAANSPMTDITLGTLRRVFLSEPVSGPGGLRLVGFNQPPGARAREVFDRAVLGMDPDQAARYWVDQRIRGGARPPRQVNSISLLRQVISRFPGGVGYLTLPELDASIRPLTINGAGPEAPHYPLR